MTRFEDNISPYLSFVEGSAPSSPAATNFRLYYDSSDHLLKWKNSAGTVVAIATGTAMTNPMTTKGDVILGDTGGTPTRLGAGTSGYALTSNGAAAFPSWQAVAGGSISTVDQDISADFTTASDSAWHDITGLTGISLAAGTWIGMVDLETVLGGNYGPVFRIWDGTTTYAQMGLLVSSPVAAVSSHYHFNSKPFVLGGSATMVIQVFSDTVFTVKKYPTRGGLSTSVATHVTFIKIA